MPNKEKTSDGWLLLSVLYADGGSGANLEAVLTSGDQINHAIFSENELIDGLSRLQQAQLIQKKGALIYKTKKAEQLLEDIRSRGLDLYQQWDIIDEYLTVNNINKMVVREDPDIKMFVMQGLKSAYESYVNKMSPHVRRSLLKNE